jgi:hypothetical protein
MNPYLFNTLLTGSIILFIIVLFTGIFVGLASIDAFDYFSCGLNRPKKCKGIFRVLLYNYKCLSQMREGKVDPWGHESRKMDWEDYIGVFSIGIWITVVPIGLVIGLCFLLRYFTTFESGRMVLLGLSIIAGGIAAAYWLLKGFWTICGKLGSGIDKVESVVEAVEKTVEPKPVDGKSRQLSEDHATTEVRVTT